MSKVKVISGKRYVYLVKLQNCCRYVSSFSPRHECLHELFELQIARPFWVQHSNQQLTVFLHILSIHAKLDEYLFQICCVQVVVTVLVKQLEYFYQFFVVFGLG